MTIGGIPLVLDRFGALVDFALACAAVAPVLVAAAPALVDSTEVTRSLGGTAELRTKFLRPQRSTRLVMQVAICSAPRSPVFGYHSERSFLPVGSGVGSPQRQWMPSYSAAAADSL